MFLKKVRIMNYYTYKQYLADKFGEELYKIPIDFNTGCPNRDSEGLGGCTFCPENGNRAAQITGLNTVRDQVNAAIKFSKKRYKANKFMAYIQAYTAFFSKEWQKKYLEILNEFEFDALSIGTRPDCINQDTIEFVKQLNIPVIIELGVQTLNDISLLKINRGHDSDRSLKAVQFLNDNNIEVAVHLIIGLPNETIDDNILTVKKLSHFKLAGIKFHNLHIIEGTNLAREYEKENFNIYTENQYAEILIELFKYVPGDIPILRVCTDTEIEKLIAPKWHMNKGQFTEYFNSLLKFRDVYQGQLTDKAYNPLKVDNYDKTITDDGSITLFSNDFKEKYHCHAGALMESVKKYIEPSGFEKLIKQNDLHILDICFGLGYNSYSSVKTASGFKNKIKITCLEIDRRVVKKASEIEYADKWWSNVLRNLYDWANFVYLNCELEMKWGDARFSIETLKGKYDIIYLDAFSTQKNSELWTLDFIKKIKRVIKDNGVVLTYCAAIPVRKAFIEAGFFIGETVAAGRDRGGTIASLDPSKIEIQIPLKDYELFKTTKGIVYRDPYSTYTNREILKNREFEVVKFKKIDEAEY
ncbi:MAG: TIGR01212 family radical SAM protein [Candidatus Delongbacteria bacterium]|nr:TIGR01212 family radical SAM protein [Candidatus Delongbacteria bacterium]MBN2833587.1 TIGR01212 family radical SAM protein [Candidatus Delongbacteria bacterium]